MIGVEEPQENQAPAAGDQDVGAGPEDLDDRKAQAPERARAQAGGTGGDQGRRPSTRASIRLRSNWPASTPSSAVATAGIVESSPSLSP